MGTGILQFAVLGLGAGGVYALAGLGVVLVYRGAGVVNFAAGAIGMLGAFIYYDQRGAGTPALIAWGAALGYAALAGIAMHLLVMRPLRSAPAISRLIATLAVFTVIFSWADNHWGENARVVPSILPTNGVRLASGIAVGEDRLILLGIALALTTVLSFVYRRTWFGLATSAVVENGRVASSYGVFPDAVSLVNWIVGSMLGVASATLIVNVTGLSVLGLTMLVIPALAAALLGGFKSFTLTLVGGLTIGVLEAEVGWLSSYLTRQSGHPVPLEGWAQTIPFLVIVVVLVVRGRGLPIRGEATEQPAQAGGGRVPSLAWAVWLAGVLAVALIFGPSLVESVETTAAVGVVLLSIVVVTGYGGQLSLAQFALAGFGAWLTALLFARAGVPFALAAPAGVLAAVPMGLAVGLPSLRARGVNLAVATLALALVIEAQIFDVGSRTGGLLGFDIHGATLFGLSIDPVDHPQRYAVFALFLFMACVVVVSRLRRSPLGRRMLAVRSNERAAASLGISVYRTKLSAFAIASGLAAAGGILLLFQQQTAVFVPTFSSLQSIFAIVFAVLGGVGYILGALIGALIAPGGLGTVALGKAIPALQTDSTVQLLLAAGVLLTLWWRPDGIASALAGRRRGSRHTHPLVDARPQPLKPATLTVRSLSVRYGGIRALDDVSLTVRPGRITGVIGPNGAGKTTLIDAISGFAKASGVIEVNGDAVDSWAPHRRARAGIGRTFQGLELFDALTVRENLLTGGSEAEFAPAVQALSLEDALDGRPNELSFGRRRLVALARVLAARPSLLLLDEPSSGLDDRETAELADVLRTLASDWGAGILLVEHDIALIKAVCDELIVLDRGKHLCSGSVSNVSQDPAVITAYLGEAAAQPPATRRSRTDQTSHGSQVQTHGLRAGYGDLVVVRDLDLVVHDGEIVALLGPNGAGKTTTLLTLAGELPALGGEAQVVGMTGRSPLHRRARAGLAFVPEERGIINSLSAGENFRLSHSLVSHGVRIFPELEPLLRRRAGSLSGGEQQMLAVGVALARRPKLLLIDELSLGLAPKVSERLLSAIRQAADQGTGVLLVEQHAAAALSIADRALIMRNGRIELEGDGSSLATDAARIEAAYLGGLGTDQSGRHEDACAARERPTRSTT